LDIKRGLTARSDRVKCIDQHPTEPWMLAALYNGNIHVWHMETQQLVKSFEVCDLPVRAAKFVARKNWVVSGSDDMMMRVFNYNTLERVHAFEAHSDYIRSLVVHPTQPLVLSSADDMHIKLWNWDLKWANVMIFEGHTHYVMQIVINPKDNNTFASASLDRDVKVWQLGSPKANFSLEGHQRGVNCVDYSHHGDKPYLISGADDCLVKVWDYQNKTCVHTLDGHAQNISSVQFHPSLPILITGSEDCTIKLWHANTYRLQNSLNYGLDRVWCIAAQRGSNALCIGYDEGSVMVKLGREEPAMSMDVSGKMVFARHSELQQANLRATADAVADIEDGERLPLAVKDMGACEIYPQTIKHNPNGRFVVVCGDGEYIIYTAMALRNKAFGSALEFCWGLDSSEYATRESNYNVKLFKNFKEKKSFKPDFGCETMFGGNLLGCGSSGTGLAFYDWESLTLVRRIEIQAKQVFWAESGNLLAIATEDNYFVLRYDAEAVQRARDSGEELTDDGIENAFDLLEEVPEVVRTGTWVGDCFIYTTNVNRLNYYVGGEIVTIAHLDRTLYLLGYIAKDNRVYLGDKELGVVSYEVHLSVLDYQTAVMRRDFDQANAILPTIPMSHRTRVAQFLEKQGFAKKALAVTTDPDHKFSIALSLGEVDTCVELAAELKSDAKWLQCEELAQRKGDMETAKRCLIEAKDHAGLLLQASAQGNKPLVSEVATLSIAAGRYNVAFVSLFISGQLEKCLDLLINTKRLPEAALFARSYLPSHVPRILKLWRVAAGPNIGPMLADPRTYDNLFPGIQDTLKAEKFRDTLPKDQPAALFPTLPTNVERDIMAEMREAEEAGTFSVEDHELGYLDDDDEEEAEATEEQAQQAPSQAAVSELLQEAATDSPRLTARSDDLMTDDTTSAGRDERCDMLGTMDDKGEESKSDKSFDDRCEMVDTMDDKEEEAKSDKSFGFETKEQPRIPPADTSRVGFDAGFGDDEEWPQDEAPAKPSDAQIERELELELDNLELQDSQADGNFFDDEQVLED